MTSEVPDDGRTSSSCRFDRSELEELTIKMLVTYNAWDIAADILRPEHFGVAKFASVYEHRERLAEFCDSSVFDPAEDDGRWLRTLARSVVEAEMPKT